MSDDLYDIGDLPNTSKPVRPSLGRWLFRLALVCVLLLVLAGGATGFSAYLLYDHISQPRAVGDKMPFTVPPGASGNDVGALLADQGFVEHELFFRVAMRLSPSGESIKHGDFLLPKGVSPVQLLEMLRTNIPIALEKQTVRVTIPEGLTLNQMSELRDRPGQFLAAAASLDLFDQFSISAQSPEGFLMPNTYFFSNEPGEHELVQRMADQFNKDFAVLIERYPDQANVDRVAILTVASLVEEEARLDEERGFIAAVVYNRLAKNMRLEMDSTLQYVLGKYGQRLLNEDKEVDSPYNTYKYRGLPPGPISNPGIKSIEAAMNPDDVDYLFFVSNADGKSHTFSTTLREHNAAVAKFRRDIKKQRREQSSE